MPHFISLSQLLSDHLDLPCCWLEDGKSRTRRDLFHDAVTLSHQLPHHCYAINCCEYPYFFMVSYLAVILKGQITLLPPNKTQGMMDTLFHQYPDHYCLSDHSSHKKEASIHINWGRFNHATSSFPCIDCERIISIAFTSGSTGQPKAIAKNWREFEYSTERALQRFKLNNIELTLVSTVPMQHMYGLETCFFWVLFSKLSVYNNRPFYPQDIYADLKKVNKALLVSTPTHLKICVDSKCPWDNTVFILSATATMPIKLATRIEHAFKAPLFEIYGSTETLSFASKRSVVSTSWHLYSGISLSQQQQHFFIQKDAFQQAIQLDDAFSIETVHYFKNLGRADDVIKISGKRASLSELNSLLIQSPQIIDGVFFKIAHERLSAFVVSNFSKKDIMTTLRYSIDPVFLPRQLHYLSQLPRNATGKLIQSDLTQLIQGLKDD